MARKTTKGKKGTQTASAKRRTGKAAKKPRKPASTTSHLKPAVPTTNEFDPDRERILGTVPATLHRGGDLRVAAPDRDVGPPRRAIR